MESVQCSCCRCVRAVADFKVSKAGKRNKTCMRCSSGAPKVADPPAPKVAVEVADLPAPKVADEVADSGMDSYLRSCTGEARAIKQAIEYKFAPGMTWGNRDEWYVGFKDDINGPSSNGKPATPWDIYRRLRPSNVWPMWHDPAAH